MLVTATVVVGFYLFVSSIKPDEPVSKQTKVDGTMELVLDNKKKAPTPEQLAVDAEKKKNKFLKRVDEGPEKDRAQADQYLKKALREAKKGASK